MQWTEEKAENQSRALDQLLSMRESPDHQWQGKNRITTTEIQGKKSRSSKVDSMATLPFVDIELLYFPDLAHE